MNLARETYTRRSMQPAYINVYICMYMIFINSALDCYVGGSHNYSGTVSKSISGHTCQRWNESYPWTVSSLPVNPLDQETNYCRASEDDGIIWCYTTSTDQSYRWEVCQVVPCKSLKHKRHTPNMAVSFV